MSDDSVPIELSRYAKQIRFPDLGIEGQRKLSASRVLVIGCGALGSVSANLLARAGVGELLLVDRDFVELDNLQRQVLYDERDVGQPKAIVAAEKLRLVNSAISIHEQIADIDCRNIETLLLEPRPVDVVIDGTDNFEIRFLINDACIRHDIPWIYGGCLGAEGQTMVVIPGETACLKCLLTDGPPAPGSAGTCDTGGILSTIVNVVAAVQVNEAIKLLSGNRGALDLRLNVFDLWGNRNQSIDLVKLRESNDCIACNRRQFEWLSGLQGSHSVALCGRNSVQINYPERQEIDLEALSDRLKKLGAVEANEWLVRLAVGDYVITAFRDGRAIVGGTDDVAVARKLYAQYLGA